MESSSETCTCRHRPALHPVAFPTSFQSIFCWSFHRLQWQKRCTSIWATILPPPPHHQHLWSSRCPYRFRYVPTGACPGTQWISVSMPASLRFLAHWLIHLARCCPGPGSRCSVRRMAACESLKTATFVTLCVCSVSFSLLTPGVRVRLPIVLHRRPPFVRCRGGCGKLSSRLCACILPQLPLCRHRIAIRLYVVP
jgi:hypothetical protein